MEAILTTLKNLFDTYGMETGAVTIITVLLVNIIKKPIVAYADKYAAAKGRDKSEITRYISILPFGIAMLLSFVIELFRMQFKIFEIDYPALATSALMSAAMAVASYETIKKQLEAYASKVNAKKQNAALAEIDATKQNLTEQCTEVSVECQTKDVESAEKSDVGESNCSSGATIDAMYNAEDAENIQGVKPQLAFQGGNATNNIILESCSAFEQKKL